MKNVLVMDRDQGVVDDRVDMLKKASFEASGLVVDGTREVSELVREVMRMENPADVVVVVQELGNGKEGAQIARELVAAGFEGEIIGQTRNMDRHAGALGVAGASKVIDHTFDALLQALTDPHKKPHKKK